MKLVFCILLGVFAFAGAVPAQNTVQVGSAAPSFQGTSIDGTDYSLDQMRGQVVVLTFWSTRCQICKSELPRVNQLIRGYDGKNVTFLAITTENDAQVQNYLRTSPQAARVISNGFGTLLAYADRDAAGNINFGYPAFFVIDKQGVLAYKASGWDRTEPLSRAINAALAQAGPASNP